MGLPYAWQPCVSTHTAVAGTSHLAIFRLAQKLSAKLSTTMFANRYR